MAAFSPTRCSRRSGTGRNRPLDAVYPVVFFGALRVKIRDEGLVRNKAVYLALAITCQCEKEVLGLWIEQPRAPSSGSR